VVFSNFFSVRKTKDKIKRYFLTFFDSFSERCMNNSVRSGGYDFAQLLSLAVKFQLIVLCEYTRFVLVYFYSAHILKKFHSKLNKNVNETLKKKFLNFFCSLATLPLSTLHFGTTGLGSSTRSVEDSFSQHLHQAQ
jgi:hypothetical protein